MSKYMTPNEVAERLESTSRTVRNWANRGYGPPALRMPNGYWKFPRAEFEKWHAENMTVAA